MTAVREYFEGTRVGHGAYLKPFKRLLVDIFVSKGTLTRALDVANEFFLSLEDHNYQVVLAPRDQHCRRPDLDQRERGGRPNYGLDSWHPERPTVLFIGSIAFGLTLYEMTENVEVRYHEGGWVRVSEAPIPNRRGHRNDDTFTSRSDLPSGRLASSHGFCDGDRVWVLTAAYQIRQRTAGRNT